MATLTRGTALTLIILLAITTGAFSFKPPAVPQRTAHPALVWLGNFVAQYLLTKIIEAPQRARLNRTLEGLRHESARLSEEFSDLASEMDNLRTEFAQSQERIHRLEVEVGEISTVSQSAAMALADLRGKTEEYEDYQDLMTLVQDIPDMIATDDVTGLRQTKNRIDNYLTTNHNRSPFQVFVDETVRLLQYCTASIDLLRSTFRAHMSDFLEHKNTSAQTFDHLERELSAIRDHVEDMSYDDDRLQRQLVKIKDTDTLYVAVARISVDYEHRLLLDALQMSVDTNCPGRHYILAKEPVSHPQIQVRYRLRVRADCEFDDLPGSVARCDWGVTIRDGSYALIETINQQVSSLGGDKIDAILNSASDLEENAGAFLCAIR